MKSISMFRRPHLAMTLLAFCLSTASYAADEKIAAEAFIKPVSDYKLYVLSEIDALVDKTKQFTDAIDAGRLDEAKLLYASTRIHYERTEPAAEMFGDLDPSIDAREDDYKLKAEDPNFTGFHRLEKILFSDNTTEGTKAYTERLMADVLELQKRLKDEAIPVVTMVQGSADLMEEIAQTKISGEEERYSRTDLWDFAGNLEGSIKIVELLSPLIEKVDPALLNKIREDFKAAEHTLHKYKTEDGNGFQSYLAVTEEDKVLMRSQITTLAEELATLRGVLGLDN